MDPVLNKPVADISDSPDSLSSHVAKDKAIHYVLSSLLHRAGLFAKCILCKDAFCRCFNKHVSTIQITISLQHSEGTD